MKRRSILCLAGLMAAVIFAGCRREKTQVYEVPREAPSAPVATPQPQAAPQSADQASMPQATTPAVPPLNFQIPANWRQNQATGMRMASFTASGTNGQTADVSVIPLPLMGHETALVNMWRQQVGLPEIGDAEAAAAAQPVTVGGEPGKLFEFTGGQPLDGKARSRILVAMASHDSMSWFFKMTGDASFVGTQKDAFLQFLKSVSFPTQSSAPSQEAAIEAQPALPAAETPNPPPSSTPDWTVPAGWTKVPPAEFLAAEFSIAGNNGAAADVNAAVLDGSGGGVLPNINRWRGQLGLSPATAATLATMTAALNVGGGTATVLDVRGTDSNTGKKTRLVGVILPLANQTWFFKLMGDEKVVAAQKDGFFKFIQSGNYQ